MINKFRFECFWSIWKRNLIHVVKNDGKQYKIMLIILLIIITSSTIIPFTLTSSHALVIDIADLCPNQHHLLLMIDTGSSQFWLMDNGCWTCPHTQSFCPHISNSNQKISYVKGEVLGSFSFLSLCEIRNKFLCVKEIKNMGTMESHGLLGIGGNSTGYQFIEKLFSSLRLQEDIITFYYGKHQHKLILGPSFQTYTKGFSLIYKKTSNSWKLKAKTIKVSNQILAEDVNVLLDTGSSKIVLPPKQYSILFKTIQQILKTTCKQTLEGIACRHVDDIHILLQVDGKTLEIGHLIDHRRNIIHVLRNADNNVILGYPFFKSYVVSNNFNESTISLYQYPLELQRKEEINHALVLVLYVMALFGLIVCCLKFYDHYNQKRSTTIVI